MELATKYSPDAVEGKWYQYWLDHKLFSSKPDGREAYTVVIPPPNVTGVLHMGHMLNNTIQDILVRRARMQGKNACWVPGTDHASIATEAKIVEAMRKEGVTKDDLGRDGFLERAWEWKKQYGGRIIEQLKKLYATVKKYQTEVNDALIFDLGKSHFEGFMCESGLVLSEISFFSKINVNGPGQNLSITRFAFSGISSTISFKASTSAMCTIKGLSDGRPFAAYVFIAASSSSAFAPRPYTVSVGNATNPPCFKFSPAFAKICSSIWFSSNFSIIVFINFQHINHRYYSPALRNDSAPLPLTVLIF